MKQRDHKGHWLEPVHELFILIEQGKLSEERTLRLYKRLFAKQDTEEKEYVPA